MSAASPVSSRKTHVFRLYLSAITALGAVVLVRAAIEAARAPQPLAWMTLAMLALVSAWCRLNFKSVSATVGIDDTFCITAALFFGPGPATLALTGHALLYSWRRSRPARQMLFNATALALAMWMSARTFFLLAGVGPLALSGAAIQQAAQNYLNTDNYVRVTLMPETVR